jgi:hypothetical protein
VKKSLISVALAAAVFAVPVAAGAKKPDDPGSKGKSNSQTHKQKAKTHKALLPSTDKRCKVHKVGFNGSGALTAYGLTQSQGAATPAKGDDRYSGTLSVDVTKANHKAAKGPQDFTVTDIKVKFGPGVTSPPANGSRVSLHGKITKVNKKCDQSGAGVITLRQIEIKVAKPYAI